LKRLWTRRETEMNYYYYLKSTMFWDVTLYSLIEIQRRFGGTCSASIFSVNK
jgi:hypothetical protein